MANRRNATVYYRGGSVLMKIDSFYILRQLKSKRNAQRNFDCSVKNPLQVAKRHMNLFFMVVKYRSVQRNFECTVKTRLIE